MTPSDVADLCARIVSAWPTADRTVWAVALEPCEFEIAERTLTTLRQRLQRLPSIVEFTAEYALQGPERTRLSAEEIAVGLERVAWLKSLHASSRGVS